MQCILQKKMKILNEKFVDCRLKSVFYYNILLPGLVLEWNIDFLLFNFLKESLRNIKLLMHTVFREKEC